MFDLVVGAILGLIALPLVAIGAALSAVSLRAWPFFVQRRVGRHGRPFRIVKIRTLPTSTPRYIDKYGLDDRAIPATMRWMRAVHLDELPQLYLAIVGTMSLVGPRPEMRHLHESMAPDVAAARVSVRPGCTGLWQVSDLAPALISQGTKLDVIYVEHQSLRFDVWLMWRTLLLAFRSDASVSADRLPRWIEPANDRSSVRAPRSISVDASTRS